MGIFLRPKGGAEFRVGGVENMDEWQVGSEMVIFYLSRYVKGAEWRRFVDGIGGRADTKANKELFFTLQDLMGRENWY